jgi:hypothetical protein
MFGVQSGRDGFARHAQRAEFTHYGGFFSQVFGDLVAGGHTAILLRVAKRGLVQAVASVASNCLSGFAWFANWRMAEGATGTPHPEYGRFADPGQWQ